MSNSGVSMKEIINLLMGKETRSLGETLIYQIFDLNLILFDYYEASYYLNDRISTILGPTIYKQFTFNFRINEIEFSRIIPFTKRFTQSLSEDFNMELLDNSKLEDSYTVKNSMIFFIQGKTMIHKTKNNE